MKHENTAFLFYIVLGIIVGAASLYLPNPLFSLALAVVMFFAGGFSLSKITKEKRELRWLITNGGWLYFFVWLLAWILLFNLFPHP